MKALLLGLFCVSLVRALPYDVDNSPLQQNLDYLEAMAKKNAASVANLQLSTTGVTAVTASAPLSSSGGTTPNITFSGSLAQSQITNLTTDLGNKAAKGANGDITSMTALTSITSSVNLSSGVVIVSTLTVGGGAYVVKAVTAAYFYGNGSGLSGLQGIIAASSGTNADITAFKSTYTFLAAGTFVSSITISTTASISTLTIPSPGILSFPGYLMIDKNGIHRASQDPNAAPADTRNLRIEAQHSDADTAPAGSVIIEGGTAGGGATPAHGGSLFFLAGQGNNAAGGALVLKSGEVSSCDVEQSSAAFVGGQADGRGQGGSFVLKSAAPTGDCGVNVGGGSVQFNGGFGSGNQPGGSMSFTSGVGGPSGVGGNITISASSGSTNGSIFVGGLTYSTFTRAGTLNMGAPFNLMTKTLAELKAIAPAIGDLYRCSNCVVPFSIAEGTGTSAGNFAIFAPGAFQ